MVPIVRQHPMLLFSRVVCGLIPKSGDKKGMKAAQTSENEYRKLVENHFPMSVYFSAKIYPLCELPRKVKSLILKLGRFSFHMTPAEMENMTPSAYHRTAAPSKRTPQLLPVQHRQEQLSHFSPLAGGAPDRSPGSSPQEKFSPASVRPHCSLSLLAK